ncbi:MAG: LamG-like jellyroll fold domain-containing protein, partial [Phycisphaeraceae bacterium]
HQPLRLRSGSAVLETIHGVQLLLSGKAEMVMTDAALAELQQGRLAVDVPKRSGDEADRGGYTVVTPNARVVSLSTAFGVEVTDDGETQVHVFEGKVHVVDLDADAAPRTVGKTVARGEAVRVGRGGVVAVAHEPSRFTAAEPSKRLNVGADYVAAVLDKKPLAYWRFETTARGLIRNEANDRHHAWPVGGLTADGPAGSRIGRFNATVGERYLFVDERLTGLAGSDYTIELWVKPEQRQHATLINLSGNAEAFDAEALEHAVVIELWPDDRGVRFLHRSPAGHSGGTDVFTGKRYALDAWQHIVATKAGDRMTVYLDGEAAAEGRDETTMPVDPFVSIGRLTLPGEQNQSRRNIVGSMSDVAVYDRALSASEIQQHYQLIHRSQQMEGE